MVPGCGVYTALEVQCTYVLLATTIARVAAASCVLCMAQWRRVDLWEKPTAFLVAAMG
jgi:hypothetical protein